LAWADLNSPRLMQVLMELKEYASEVDVDFVRRAIRCIGRCAIKIDKAAERCIRVLLDLIQTQVDLKTSKLPFSFAFADYI